MNPYYTIITIILTVKLEENIYTKMLFFQTKNYFLYSLDSGEHFYMTTGFNVFKKKNYDSFNTNNSEYILKIHRRNCVYNFDI